MDTWLFKVLKDTLLLHEIDDHQAKRLLDRIIFVLFPHEKNTHRMLKNEETENGINRTNRKS